MTIGDTEFGLLNKDLWPGCDAFFDAIAETIYELDPNIPPDILRTLPVNEKTRLGRRMEEQLSSMRDQEQQKSFSRLRAALLQSFQKLASAQMGEDPQAPSM